MQNVERDAADDHDVGGDEPGGRFARRGLAGVVDFTGITFPWGR